jgi:hypothetical protein
MNYFCLSLSLMIRTVSRAVARSRLPEEVLFSLLAQQWGRAG